MISSGPTYVVYRVGNTHINYQFSPSRDTEYPLMFLYTGISRLDDGLALYTGDLGDPVFPVFGFC